MRTKTLATGALIALGFSIAPLGAMTGRWDPMPGQVGVAWN